VPKPPDFDTAAAHKYFAAHCFNSSWPLIEKQDRSPAEDEALVAMAHASLWHWTQRPDCTDQNLSVGHWLLSRVYSVLGDAAQAQRYARSCLRFSERDGVAPFYLGYAYEALARAAALGGDRSESARFLGLARQAAERVNEQDERKMLLDDLARILST